MKRITSHGTCCLCGKRTSKAAITRHLGACTAEHEASRGRPRQLYQLRVEGDHDPFHWLDLEIPGESTLWDLDEFLRGIWLECCGHLSAFHIGHSYYMLPAALEDDGYLGVDEEYGMDVPVSEALGSGKTRFSYDYDFGSTTRLQLRVVRQRMGAAKRRPSVRLLARNDAPIWPCSVCERPATALCSGCLDGEESFYCAEHAPGHDCGEEMMLPVVNSPRIGVCAYTGPVSDNWNQIDLEEGDVTGCKPGTSESIERAGG